MHRVLFRIGVLAAAIVAGGTALVAVNARDAGVRTLAATQASDGEICLYVGGVWHCFEDPNGGPS